MDLELASSFLYCSLFRECQVKGNPDRIKIETDASRHLVISSKFEDTLPKSKIGVTQESIIFSNLLSIFLKMLRTLHHLFRNEKQWGKMSQRFNIITILVKKIDEILKTAFELMLVHMTGANSKYCNYC